MDDLILKFFQEDLSEAEEKALSERLLTSTSDALRFGEQAEKAYVLFGLPEPVWHGSTQPPQPGGTSPGTAGGPHGLGGGTHSFHLHHLFHGLHLGLKPILLASAVVTAGVTGTVIYHQKMASQPVPIPPTPVVIQNPVPTALPPAAPVKAVAPPKRPEAVKPQAPSLPATPVLTPIDMAASPHRTYSNLAVVVNRPSKGKVTLRVLDSAGEQVVLLYDGELNPGSWVFDWDGRGQDGKSAPAGTYQIRVESGPVTQKKKIVIK